jgi:hypothetical protein
VALDAVTDPDHVAEIAGLEGDVAKAVIDCEPVFQNAGSLFVRGNFDDAAGKQRAKGHVPGQATLQRSEVTLGECLDEGHCGRVSTLVSDPDTMANLQCYRALRHKFPRSNAHHQHPAWFGRLSRRMLRQGD